MAKLFQIIPEEFFKPLTSRYRQEYADSILLIYNTFKPEISYGVNREIVVKELTVYFDADDEEISFDEEHVLRDARDKANAMIAQLKKCGWLEYEQVEDHRLNVSLMEYAIPIIESMDRIIREQETEYQGLISQIHASLQNKESYVKPYELVIMGVRENTERLISELKRLNVSIKRHMDRQTADMDAAQILDHFFEYHQNIGSKAYMRLKTSDNISRFRGAIIDGINGILENSDIMGRAVKGYMEVEQQEDEDLAYDALITILTDVKASFYRLNDIIEEIDRKHSKYMRNAVMRARFKLSTGNNLEGKLSRVLDHIAERINENDEDIMEDSGEMLAELASIYPQYYISPESLRTVPVSRAPGKVDRISTAEGISREERIVFREALKEKNRKKFSRKKVDAFVSELLGDRKKIGVDEIPVECRRDLIRIVYISIYAGNRANCYSIKRSKRRVRIGEYELPFFEIIRR